jgi:hypothetical protein
MSRFRYRLQKRQVTRTRKRTTLRDGRLIGNTEVCVYCQVDTGVAVGLDISQRLFYITDVGQLCHDCYLS